MTLRKATLLIAALTLVIGNSSFSLPQRSDEQEYALKAALIYRFTDYVEGNLTGSETFNIAVLGKSAIIEPLGEIASSKKVKNRKMSVKEYENLNSLLGAEVIFVSKNFDMNLDAVLSRLDYKPSLIITEQNGACVRGSHINFITSDNKLRFEVNLRTVRRSGLKLSSQLLQHAYALYNN